MDIITSIFSKEHLIHWVEVFVILAIAAFFLYVSYSLNLFKKD